MSQYSLIIIKLLIKYIVTCQGWGMLEIREDAQKWLRNLLVGKDGYVDE
jgi:hypothetical protein